MNKQEIIRFVIDCKTDGLKSALVILSDDKRACPFIEGDNSTLAASLVMVAKNNPDFEAVLAAAVAYLKWEGGEE